ncbi:MAG: FAD-dependent oxidoreductase, partial [Caulobacteraceae bacterium]
VTPRLDAGLAAPAALFAHAFRRAVALYALSPEAIVAKGAIHLPVGEKDPTRFAAIAGSDLFEPAALRLAGAPETTARLGETAPAGLIVETALVVEPATLLAAWSGEVHRLRVAAVERRGEAWELVGDDGEPLGAFDTVCLAAGMGSALLAPGLALAPVRGQASIAQGPRPPVAGLFGAYAIPIRQGVMFGATHDRDDEDARPRAGDHRRNLQSLARGLPALAARLADARLEAHTAIRATTRDYLPLAGALGAAQPGLLVLSGLGSRGFTLAPLLGEHLAALIVGAASPLPRDLAALVEPARFARRARRAGRLGSGGFAV